MAYTICSEKQRTQEWLNARKGLITGSIVSAIIGNNRYLTDPHQITATILGMQIMENIPMQIGNAVEDQIRSLYTAITGNSVKEIGFVRWDVDSRFGASADGIVNDDGLLEIKYTRSRDVVSYLKNSKFNDIIYPSHMDQINFTCGILGLMYCDYVVYSDVYSEHTLYIRRIAFSPSYFEYQLSKGREFYDKYLT